MGASGSTTWALARVAQSLANSSLTSDDTSPLGVYSKKRSIATFSRGFLAEDQFKFELLRSNESTCSINLGCRPRKRAAIPAQAANSRPYSLSFIPKPDVGDTVQPVDNERRVRVPARERMLNETTECGSMDFNFDQLDRQGIAALLQRTIPIAEGKRLHAHITRRGLEGDTFLGNLLISMYRKYGALQDARLVFDKMHRRNLVSWNSIIGAYCKHGSVIGCLELFRHMQQEGVEPDKITFVSLLGACSIQGALAEGKIIHSCIVKCGLELDIMTANVLIDMYGKCRALEDAYTMFENMPQRNVISWTVMIAAYAENGSANEALMLFRKMQQQGVQPDKITFINLLGACACPAAMAEAKAAHALMVEYGLQSDIVAGNSLVNMYGKCGALENARSVFHNMPMHNVESWNAIITAFALHKCSKEALKLFQQMQQYEMEPDNITLSSVLGACSVPADTAVGNAVHAYIRDKGFEPDIGTQSALVNMYGKCGALLEAQAVFDEMRQHDVVSWTALIASYSQHGHGEEALKLFQQMKQEGVEPNKITFTCLLSACTHAGLVEEGHYFFRSMMQEHGITPELEHNTCMIDLLGRAGHTFEAENFINQMPFEPDAQAWMTLLGACKIHGDVKQAEHAAQKVFELDPQNTDAYILLSNIYASAERWDDVERTREIMIKKGFEQVQKSSSIAVESRMQEASFLNGSRVES